MTGSTSTPSSLLGFLVFEKTQDQQGYVAALMVTDDHGYPLEFRATTPVRPSLVQRTLYGNQLEPYVGIELCGKTLVKESQRKPRVFLVPEQKLLAIGDDNPVNIVAVWRAGDTLRPEHDDAPEKRGTLMRPGGRPLVYEGRFLDSQQETALMSLLDKCNNQFDLHEAFERMRAALSLLAKEDSRYA